MSSQQLIGGPFRGRLNYLVISRQVLSELVRTSRKAEDKYEICGLLGGSFREDGVATALVIKFLPNLTESHDHFLIDVEEFIASRSCIESSGHIPIAFIHSHPNGSTRPSLQDIKLPSITGLASVIFVPSEPIQIEGFNEINGKIVPFIVDML